MRVGTFVVAVAVCFAVVNAQTSINFRFSAPPTTAYDPMPSIKQPMPLTVVENSAIKYQPLLHVTQAGCLPYPAVSDDGKTSPGLTSNDIDCRSSGSRQIYARSSSSNEVLVIMYAWFFPILNGAEWKHVVMWIDNRNVTHRNDLHLSTQDLSGEYTTIKPMEAGIMTGLRVELTYTDKMIRPGFPGNGESQDLIMWHQMTDRAKESLNNNMSFGMVKVPINDNNFLTEITKASPFGQMVIQR